MKHLKPASLFVLATLIMATGLAGSASAQEATIEMSADRFFGEGVLQIVIDTGADDDNAVEELQVNIDARPGSGSASSESILVPETSEGSGKFELFLAHVDAVAVGPADLDPDNSVGVEGDGACIADCSPFVTFGPGGLLDVQAGLYEQVDFEIGEGSVEAEVSYEEADGAVELDRDSYGTNSFVYISIIDQDANLNPTERDEFTVDPGSGPNDDLLELGGGTFEDIITFTETGDNTAVFEGRYRLGVSILAGSESLVLALHEKANYNATLAAAENDSNNIDEIGFTIGNSDGSIDVGGGQQAIPTWDPIIDADSDSYAIGESVHVTITDQDANVDPDAADSINLQISSGGSNIEVAALETGADTGVFEAGFQLVETDAGQGAIAPAGSITITYTDEFPADYSEKVQAGEDPEKDFALEIDVQLPVRTGVETTDVTAPAPVDVSGGGGLLVAGAQVTLSMTISNNNDQPQPFVALIEVRDSDGVTVFIALQGGTLDPLGSAEIGALWQPDRAGTFEARTFAIADIGSGEVLSPVAMSEITISQAQ